MAKRSQSRDRTSKRIEDERAQDAEAEGTEGEDTEGQAVEEQVERRSPPAAARVTRKGAAPGAKTTSPFMMVVFLFGLPLVLIVIGSYLMRGCG